MRIRDYAVVAVGYALLFWLLREKSYSGDYKNWARFVEGGYWYRLREPICMVLYQAPYAALKPLGVQGRDILAGMSCVTGGISMAYALASLRLLNSEFRMRLLGMAALTVSYGVTGLFFGHVEHYSIMSLGSFIYIYYALRYMKGSASIVAPSLALGLLFTTHLMAAWLVPSLVVLPWLRRRADDSGLAASRSPLKALIVMAIPNVIVWGVILSVYYAGSLDNLLNDVATGSYSRNLRVPGNALGGGNNKGFLDLHEIFSVEHIHGIAALFLLYSPFAWMGLVAAAIHRPVERFRSLLRPEGLFFLALLVPYFVYAVSWEPGRGYVEDWDLFSQITTFLVFAVFLLLTARPWSISLRALVFAGLLLGLAVTGYTTLESRRAETPTGVHSVITSMGVSAEKLSRRSK